MSPKARHRHYLALSIAGLFLVLILPIIGRVGELKAWQWDLILILLLCSYALGMVMAFRPGLLSFSSPRNRVSTSGETVGSRRFVGHHPECGPFSGHVLLFYGRTVCSGCLALGIGCAASLVLAPIVFLILPEFGTEVAGAFLLAGVLIVAINLSESLWGPARMVVHMALNFLFPVAFLMISYGAMIVTGEWLSGLWSIALGFLWIDTRKVISRQRHLAICRGCPAPCKSFSP